MDSVQLRARARVIIAEGAMSRGQVFWAKASRAKHYIDQGVAEPVGAGMPAAKESLEKKSSGAGRAGRSTASVRSSATPGAAPSSLQSLLGLVSAMRISLVSSARSAIGRERSRPSRSTTRT